MVRTAMRSLFWMGSLMYCIVHGPNCPVVWDNGQPRCKFCVGKQR